MQEEQQAKEDKNQPPALRIISRKLSRRHKAFADRYLVNGMNATEAYRYAFKPKVDETAHANAYKIMASQGVRDYVDEALSKLNAIDYAPESIKQGIQRLSVSAKRDADKLAALSLMAKLQGMLSDAPQQNINFINSDIMDLAKKRLSERKELSKSQNVTISESSEVVETKEDTTSMSYNNPYVPTLSESVLSINRDAKEGEQIDSLVEGDGIAGDEGSPRGTGSSTPTHPSK